MLITSRRELEELARAVVDTQLAAKHSGEPVVLGELRAKLLDGLAICSADNGELLKCYLGAMAARAAERGVRDGYEEETLWRHPLDVDFPLEQMVDEGLGCLTDDLLLEFAVRDIWLADFGELIEEGYAASPVGTFWEVAKGVLLRGDIA